MLESAYLSKRLDIHPRNLTEVAARSAPRTGAHALPLSDGSREVRLLAYVGRSRLDFGV